MITSIWRAIRAALFGQPPVRVPLRVHASNPQSYLEGIDIMARITTEQRIRVSVNPLTQAGNPAPIDGQVEIQFSNLAGDPVPTFERVDAYGGWISADTNGQGNGVLQVIAACDADLGEGVRNIVATGILEVVDPEAQTLSVTFGEPELKPGEG